MYPHQRKVYDWLSQKTINRDLVVVHSAGSGKTFTGLYTALNNLERHCVKSILIVTPNQLLHSLYKTIAASTKTKCITYCTYGTLDLETVGPDTFLILDEVHTLLSMSSLYDKLWLELHSPNRTRVKKCLLMTATPILDTHIDLLRIMNLVVDVFSQNIPTVEVWRGFCSVYDTRPCNTVETQEPQIVKVPLSPCAIAAYVDGNKKAALERDAFYISLHRIAICKAKFEHVAANILDSPPCKVFISCMYLSKCDEVCSYLKKRLPADTRYFVATSRVTPYQLGLIVDRFNACPKSQRVVLIASRLMNEGISLREVSCIYILSPFWNFARLEQTIARAIRINSHEDVNQIVPIFLYSIDTIDAIDTSDTVKNIDVFMYETAVRKRIASRPYLGVLKAASIENEAVEREVKATTVAVAVAPAIDDFWSQVKCVRDVQPPVFA